MNVETEGTCTAKIKPVISKYFNIGHETDTDSLQR